MLARSSILDLFQEYFVDPVSPVHREHLLRIMTVVGFESSSTDDAVDALVDSGWLMYSPPTESYTASAGLLRTLEEGRIKGGHRPRRPWNGEWFQIVIHDCAGRRDSDRQLIHGVLRWLGYGQISDCSWIHFIAKEHEFAQLARENVGTVDFTTLRSTSQNLGHDRRLAESAWQLHDLDIDYGQFIETFEPRCRAFSDRTPSPEVALIERLSVLNAFRHFVVRDPALPHDLLPRNWQGRHAHQIYEGLLTLLAEEAQRFVESVVGSTKNLEDDTNVE